MTAYRPTGARFGREGHESVESGFLEEGVQEIPYLTVAEMQEVDRAMIEDRRIELIQMMESAGRALARLACDRFLGGDPVGRQVVVLCGAGNNGGGGLVAARRLHGWGARLHVFLAKPREAFLGVPEHQLDIVEHLAIPVSDGGGLALLPRADLVLDAILGFGLAGAPREGAARLIELANEYDAPVLSLDVPSGLDATTGERPGEAVRADATLALALPKRGLQVPEATPWVGELWLGDLGVPPELYRGRGLGYDVGPIFARAEVVRL